jgi:hypothetical protein
MLENLLERDLRYPGIDGRDDIKVGCKINK